MDMSLYRDLFVSEARSHLSAFSELIIRIETGSGDSATINELFRHAHSLKGMAATMGYEQIAGIAHVMETQLSRVRSGELTLQPPLADLFLECGDTLTRLMSEVEAGNSESEDTAGLLERLSSFSPSMEAIIPRPPGPFHGQNENASETLPAAVHQFRQSDSLKSIRIKTETLDHLVNISGELLTNSYRLAEAIRLADATNCREPHHQLTMLLRNLRDEVFQARMLPFAVIAERFPRLVRDLARKQDKEVQFVLEGAEIELDRGILEEIAEPIVHILRNSVDHGLESADERVMSGKPFGGTITLTVCRDKDHVEITIADDGRGMDPEHLKLKALERGLVTADQVAAMSPQEAYRLICLPGFSTAAAVTDISGRGVGMDVVREAVHALSGVLTIYSQCGAGSRFVMRLPITVSIIHALVVRCGPFEIAFPLNAVVRTLELKRTDIHEEHAKKTVILDDSPIPLLSLRELFNLSPDSCQEDALFPVVACDVGGTYAAFRVDHISGQQEIFVRPLRTPLSHLRGINGATIAGNGRVLFLADANALV